MGAVKRFLETLIYFSLTIGCGGRMVRRDEATPVFFYPIHDGDVIGLCRMYTNGTRAIQLDPDWWETASEMSHRLLIMHERGHCDWGLEHTEGARSDGCPLSIMNPNLPSDYCYTKHQQEYIEEYNGQIINEEFLDYTEMFYGD